MQAEGQSVALKRVAVGASKGKREEGSRWSQERAVMRAAAPHTYSRVGTEHRESASEPVACKGLQPRVNNRNLYTPRLPDKLNVVYSNK